MGTVPTGKMERELRKLYLQWLSNIQDHEDDLPAYINEFQKASLELIESMGGEVARLGAYGDFPAPKLLDLSPHVGTIYSDMELAAIRAGIAMGQNATATARAMYKAGMGKSFNRLNRLARTETVRAYWKNQWDSTEGLGLVMLWSVERSNRTCDICHSYDGLVVADQSIRDHPNGRCTLIPTLVEEVEYKGTLQADGSVVYDKNWDLEYREPEDPEETMKQTVGTADVFNVTSESSIDDILSSLSPVQAEAVTAYSQGKTFFNVRSAFEKGEPYVLSSGDDFFKVADSIFDNTMLAENTTLHRMMKVDPEWSSSLEPGGEILNKFFASTSRNPELAKAYGAPRNSSLEHLKLEIEAKPGTKVMPGMASLDEIVLPPGSRLKITRIEQSYSEEIWDDLTTIHCTLEEI